MRPVDVPLFAPARGAVLASTGSSEWVTNYASQFKRLPRRLLDQPGGRQAGRLLIDRSRVRKLNGTTYYDRAVVSHPRVLAGLAREPFTAGPTQPYFPFAVTDADVSTLTGAPTTRIRVPWKAGGAYTMGTTTTRRPGCTCAACRGVRTFSPMGNGSRRTTSW